MRFAGGSEPARHDRAAWDQLLCNYIEALFLAGEHVNAARYALYGVVFCLDFPRRSAEVMPLAKQTLRGFAKRAPERSRDPPCMEMLWLLVDFLLREPLDRVRVLCACFAVLCMDCYLRPSEALAVTALTVTAPRGKASLQRWAITVAPATGLQPAKNQQFDAGVVVGAHGRGWVVRILELLHRAALPDRLLFEGLCLASVEALFREASVHLGFGLVPHGLRHLGPSHDRVVHGAAIDDVQARGRWLCVESCRHYSKPAAILRSVRKLTADQLRRAAALEREIPARLETALGLVLGLQQVRRVRRRL